MKLRSLMLLIVASLFLTNPAHARRHHVAAQPASDGCNVLWPCEGVIKSVRGERAVKAMGGFGIARPQYTPRAIERTGGHAEVTGGRPAGCPYQFCGCGASLYLFGKIIPELNLAANWARKFPRAEPAPHMAAVRAHHVMVLVAHVQGSVWVVHDSNSGHHLTRVHERSIAGWTIVNPHA